MRGRKPKVTALKLVNGNPGKRKINRDEPVPDLLGAACPEEITNPVAQAEWTRAIVPAITRGQITADDRVFAIAHCELWATHRELLAEAALHPHVVSAGKGRYPIPNPARGMANKTLLLLAKVDAELGFSPTARTRVKATKAPGTDALQEKYFSARKRA